MIFSLIKKKQRQHDNGELNRANERIMGYRQISVHIYWSAVNQIIHKTLS